MRICLAPMDGITDLAYRTICKEIFAQHGNPDDQLMLWTEFMSAEGYMHNPPGVIKHLYKTDFEPELIAQIFGGTTDPLFKCAQDISDKYKFAGVEINMGCPSPSVMKCDAGSAMLKDKKKTLQILKEIHDQLSVPLSLKTRIGLTAEDKDAQFEFICEASKYVRMIVLHGRTYAQSHAGEVDREYIYKVKEALPDKVIIGNGGLRSYTDAQERRSPLDKGGSGGISTHANLPLDGVMIAQSAIGNPRILTPHTPTLTERFTTIERHLLMMMAAEYLFERAKAAMTETIQMPTYAEVCTTAEALESLLKNTQQLFFTPKEFRKYLFNYISGLPGNKEVKQRIPTRNDFNSLHMGICQYRDQLLAGG